MIAALTTSTLALLLSGMVLVLVLRLPAVLGPAWIGGPAMIRCRQGVGRQAGRQRCRCSSVLVEVSNVEQHAPSELGDGTCACGCGCSCASGCGCGGGSAAWPQPCAAAERPSLPSSRVDLAASSLVNLHALACLLPATSTIMWSEEDYQTPWTARRAGSACAPDDAGEYGRRVCNGERRGTLCGRGRQKTPLRTAGASLAVLKGCFA